MFMYFILVTLFFNTTIQGQLLRRESKVSSYVVGRVDMFNHLDVEDNYFTET